MSNKIEGVPEGWELVGIRRAKKGEFSVQGGTPEAKLWEFDSASVYPIVRKLPEPLKVEAGKYYRTKAGEVIGPMFLFGLGDDKWAYKKGKGGLWNDAGKHNSLSGKHDFAEEITFTYRPFANAEEFKPFRDKWIIRKEGIGSFRVQSYYDTWVAVGPEYLSYQELLTRKFEDGTPCGIKQ